MSGVTNIEAMAFLYRRFRDILARMPTSLEDYFDEDELPEECLDEDGSGLWELIDKADELASEYRYVGK